jgi:hypothetical protein
MIDVNMPPQSPESPPPAKTWEGMGYPPLPVIVWRDSDSISPRGMTGMKTSSADSYIPLKMEYVQLLTMSPVRHEIVQRLQAGDSAVWVLMKSGDAAKDAAAKTLLDGTLRQAEADLKLAGTPGAADDPNQANTANLPPPSSHIAVKLHFSVLEVPGTGVEADLLRGMLRPIATNLIAAVGPVVFPVFGRARALAVFWGDTLTAENIKDACAFLCGSCSCIMKAAKPGVGLLVNTDWESALSGGASDPEPMPPMEVPVAKAAMAETNIPAVVVAPKPVAAAPVLKKVEQVAPPTVLSKTIEVVLAVGILVLILGTAWILRRKDR